MPPAGCCDPATTRRIDGRPPTPPKRSSAPRACGSPWWRCRRCRRRACAPRRRSPSRIRWPGHRARSTSPSPARRPTAAPACSSSSTTSSGTCWPCPLSWPASRRGGESSPSPSSRRSTMPGTGAPTKRPAGGHSCVLPTARRSRSRRRPRARCRSNCSDSSNGASRRRSRSPSTLRCPTRCSRSGRPPRASASSPGPPGAGPSARRTHSSPPPTCCRATSPRPRRRAHRRAVGSGDRRWRSALRRWRCTSARRSPSGRGCASMPRAMPTRGAHWRRVPASPSTRRPMPARRSHAGSPSCGTRTGWPRPATRCRCLPARRRCFAPARGALKSASYAGGRVDRRARGLDAEALRDFDTGMKAAGLPALIARAGGGVRARFGAAGS